ncbi:MAG: cytidine deaminase [Saprospiraceae bacterium]|nr:cytidine deaminase [Bacteroidia bacterium]MBT8230072.1 cytidine deaminase [Bacteroidia bacterium]NNF22471.1 cytidine deaminase [Saprospiraceae bacterium]NNK89179.1 cytidine deaminase [Saprospiraceae bacterium]
MKKEKYNFECEVFDSIDLLPKEIQQLLAVAEDQLNYSYAPYSNFLVGAAAQLENGEIHAGCNQENASYPLCICAERVALYNVGSRHKDFIITAMAITAHNPRKTLNEPCMPCGACRQVIQEFEQRQNSPMDLYLTGDSGKIIKIAGIKNILPLSFNINNLI